MPVSECDDEKLKILFLAADPSDTTRLRLGQESREIQEKLKLSKQAKHFSFSERLAVRPGDLSQALLDIEPHIVHFSGHGTNLGQLCFEDIHGKVKPVDASALAALFELVAENISCLLLNACYSAVQAEAIAKHVPFIIGMNADIGDKAAITFSVGFYKALCSGKPIDKAYKFGCVEMKLEGSQGSLNPTLYKSTYNQKKESLAPNNKDCKPLQWMLVLSGTVEEMHKEKAEALIEHLRLLLDDDSLTLKKVEKGSIKLFIESEEESFEILRYLFSHSEISEIFGFAVEEITYSIFDEDYLAKIIEKSGVNKLNQKKSAKKKLFTKTTVVKVVSLSGHINTTNAPQLQEKLMQTINISSPVELILNMAQVEFLDSAGLLVLVYILSVAQKMNSKLILACLPPSVQIILELTQLNRAFTILDSLPDTEAFLPKHNSFNIGLERRAG